MSGYSCRSLAEQQWAWVHAAESRLAEQLPPEHRRLVDSRPAEYSAVLIGATQHGKTSVAIDLLGVDAEKWGEVERVLRGGQTAGKSSTAALTTYLWSTSEELWGIALDEGSQELLTDQQAMNRVRSLRGVGGSVADMGRSVTIAIPRRFRNDVEATTSPIVTDLPGLLAEHAVERREARELAVRVIARADVVLLVVDSSKPTKLNTLEECGVPELAIWMLNAHKFRLVVTGAYSPDSAHADFLRSPRATQEAACDWWRDYYFDSIRLSCERVSESLEDNPTIIDGVRAAVFPLEYPDSWLNLRASNPERWATVQPVRDAFRQELLEGLGPASLSESRLLGPARAQLILEARLKAIEKRAREDAREAGDAARIASADRERAEALERERGLARDRRKQQEEALNNASKRLPHLAQESVAAVCCADVQGADGPRPPTGREHLSTLVKATQHESKAALADWRAGSLEQLGDPSSADWPLSWDTAAVRGTVLDVTNCRRKCEGRNRISNTPCGTQEECLDKHHAGLERALKSINSQLQEQAATWLDGVRNHEGVPSLKRVESEWAQAVNIKEGMTQIAEAKTAAAAAAKAELETLLSNNAGDLAEIAKFRSILDEEFDRQVQRLAVDVRATDDADAKAANTLLFLLMHQSRERVLER